MCPRSSMADRAWWRGRHLEDARAGLRGGRYGEGRKPRSGVIAERKGRIHAGRWRPGEPGLLLYAVRFFGRSDAVLEPSIVVHRTIETYNGIEKTLRDPKTLTDRLETRIPKTLRKNALGPLRTCIAQAQPVTNRDALANPESPARRT